MIIKVPIYVDITDVPAEDIQYIVERLNYNFTLDLIEAKADLVVKKLKNGNVIPIVNKIITREEAINSLRTKK